MTGVPAWERLPPSLPLTPGQPQRREDEYPRHGTLTCIVSRDVATGRVVAPSGGPTRTAADFGAPLRGVVATDPGAVRWHIGADHWNIHCWESLVRHVAELSGDRGEWGVKGRSGILKSLRTRSALRRDAGRRVVFHSTPKHAWWRNQVELWFSILAWKVRKRGRFTSVEDRKAKVLAFIADDNRTRAKPFRGNYGKPLQT
jgi:hypothetical protein